ncbi:MAG: hypothetical protein PF495_10955 [Spirochaetales bacterium]|nr:hypothetical protein [Spirochaetales bacterium]
MKFIFYLTAVVFLFLSAYSVPAGASVLHVIGVQWNIKQDCIFDEKLFWDDGGDAVRQGINDVCNNSGFQERPVAKGEDVLIVFPEYTSMVLSLIPYTDYTGRAPDMEAAWKMAAQDYGFYQLSDLFRRQTAAVYTAGSGAIC